MCVLGVNGPTKEAKKCNVDFIMRSRTERYNIVDYRRWIVKIYIKGLLGIKRKLRK